MRNFSLQKEQLAKDEATKNKDKGICSAYTNWGSTQMLCVMESLLQTWR